MGELDIIQYYAYEIIDPRNCLPFYVGKGSYDRMYKHKQQAFQSKGSKINPYKSSIIRQIINDGYELQYKKYNCKCEVEAFNLERNLIIKYKRKCEGGSLTNSTEGGEGFSGGHIPIIQYNLFGDVIKHHRSAKDAAHYLNKKYCSQITGCCKKRETSAYGYLWSYIDDTPTLRKKIKPIYQWSATGNFINRFVSMAAAAHLRCDPTNIPNAIKYHRKSQGFIWSYINTFPGQPKNKKIKHIKHVNTGIVYNSVTLAAKETAHTIQSICAVCKGKKSNVGGDEFCYVD